jgi:hypothetical protein
MQFHWVEVAAAAQPISVLAPEVCGVLKNRDRERKTNRFGEAI